MPAKILLFLTIWAVNKNQKAQENFAGYHDHDILRLFDVLPNFSFTASETKGDY